jgi:hypothetical protein
MWKRVDNAKVECMSAAAREHSEMMCIRAPPNQSFVKEMNSDLFVTANVDS